MHSVRRRFAAFGLGCAAAGWLLAGATEYYRLGVGVAVLLLLGMLLGVAWVADRLTAAPRVDNPGNEPGA